MIDLAILQGRSYVVLGLARSGLTTVRALLAAGSTASPGTTTGDPRGGRRGRHRARRAASIDWSQVTALVISPGIPNLLPKPHPMAAAARAAGVPLICDVELLAQAHPNNRFVGVTGTNGKSTTTALIGHILRRPALAVRGRRQYRPGRARPRAARAARHLRPGAVVLPARTAADLPRPRRGVAQHHARSHRPPRRHGGLRRSQGTHLRPPAGARLRRDRRRRRLFRAVFAKCAKRVRIGAVPVAFDRQVAAGVSYRAGRLLDADGHVANFAAVPTLPGDHNAQNAGCAWAACRWLRLSRAEIMEGLRTYPGLPHRQERVAALGQVTYVNDSKATNADATARALSSYDNIYWIIGGQAKEGGVAPLEPCFDRVRMPS
jgi:UDP-N-acetylmuramoylalanine--D-glutamate ligase